MVSDACAWEVLTHAHFFFPDYPNKKKMVKVLPNFILQILGVEGRSESLYKSPFS